MATPTRVEKHVIGCALCGRIAKFNESRTAFNEWFNHMRREHNKYNAYHGNSMVTMTLLFEAKDPTLDQDINHTDPTIQFLLTRSWMHERGFLIPEGT